MRLTEAERKKAAKLASMIGLSPHEWPKEQHEIQLLCHGYLDGLADNHNLRTRIAELEAERDAARAGEARAVEGALNARAWEARTARLYKRAIKALRYMQQYQTEKGTGTALSILVAMEDIDDVLKLNDKKIGRHVDESLDWLAQREREAVVAELRDWAERWWESHSDFSAGDFNQRIAALTTQKPTACPREEK
jgi:hypothetical protein